MHGAVADHPREVIEAALAHVVQNEVEAAYARSDGDVARLTLHASLNAEQFYSDLGYSVLERTEVVLPNDHRMAAVVMSKDL